ncbi:hypothetical protein [uncultured Rhodoblastus sp.]|uniref:hypothetical protein n=1 Tax=uncultured Rhodoblastus sp. TaxID=543037 RepID=UPI0025F9583D|nr:hypothetical protein [uncultured Rhodoblastus sp.]
MTKQRPICPNCGSADISRDATARWCDETQDWTLSGTFDDMTCDDCGRETNGPDWIDAGSADAEIYVFEIRASESELPRGWYVRSAEGLNGPFDEEWKADREQETIEARRKRLFNCCADNLAPDWSRFASLTVGGCKVDPEDPGHTLGLVCDAEAQFWTVYARDKDGCSEAITDCGARAEADQVAQELYTLSGLEIAR